jgi:pimeloyl-ACP methyl ester carboxylesterase
MTNSRSYKAPSTEVITNTGSAPNHIAEIIGKSKVPLLLMHGTNDEIVPFRNSEKLYRKAAGSKHFLVVDGAGHNDLLMKMGVGFWLELEKFLLKNGVIKAGN